MVDANQALAWGDVRTNGSVNSVPLSQRAAASGFAICDLLFAIVHPGGCRLQNPVDARALFVKFRARLTDLE
jgi:hypothetical protein